MAKLVFASDTFTGTAGDPLSASWVLHSGTPSGSVVISDANRARGNASGLSLYYHNTVPPSADYVVEANVYEVSNTGARVGVCARVDSSAQTYYMVEVTSSLGTDTTKLFKVVAGVSTQLGSTYSLEYTSLINTRIAVECIGTTINAYRESGLIITVTDSDISSAGFSGLSTFNPSTNSTGPHLDDWQAYRETVQYETPALSLVTSNAAPTYDNVVSAQTYTTPNLSISTTHTAPDYLSVPAAEIYTTPQLIIETAHAAPDFIIGSASDADGQHPLFWLNNQDWSDTAYFYETPALSISTVFLFSGAAFPSWTRTALESYTTPDLLIALTQIAPTYVYTSTDVVYETPSLLINLNETDPEYSTVFTPPSTPADITGISGYIVSRFSGTIGNSSRITGVMGKVE